MTLGETEVRLNILLAVILLASPLSLIANEKTPSESYFPQQMTAKELMQACASSTLTRTGREKRRYCHGFVSGVEEALRLAKKASSAGNNSAVCAPADKSSHDFAVVYMRYTVRKDVDLNRAAALVVLDALENAYPCSDAK